MIMIVDAGYDANDDDDDMFLSFLSLKKGVTLLAVGVLRVLTPPCMRFVKMMIKMRRRSRAL